MITYRPHIDGLRAIAVLSVIIFHLNEDWLPGGFVGVDIFFVISGYLISRLIFKELELTGKFSYKRFYIRRIRRLFPAMFASIGLSFIAAYFLLSPQYLLDFVQSAVWAVLSVSNIYFWFSTDYFDNSANFKPLLHTWSLGVEEQFYLLWPFALVLLYQLGKRRSLIIAIIVAGVASLVLNLLLFAYRGDLTSWFAVKDFSAAVDVDASAFYWLPFRVFEFAIGAVLIFIDWEKQKSSIRVASFLLGLAMLVASFLYLHEELDFPSYHALIPCLAAALIIISGSKHLFAVLLTNRLAVGIGLISYSLYLVHWPIIVFYKLTLLREAEISDFVLMFVGALLLATLFYKFVEQPFRTTRQADESMPSKKRADNLVFLVGSLLATLLVGAASAHAYVNKGWAARYPEEIMAQITRDPKEYVELFSTSKPYYDGPFENNGKPKLLLIGDSMSADFINALVQGGSISELDVTALRISHQCYNIFPLDEATYRNIYAGKSPVCRAEHQKIMNEEALIKQADTVILAAYWFDQKVQSHIGKTVKYLKDLGVKNVMILGQKQQAFDGTHLLGTYPLALLKRLRLPPNPKTTQLNNLLKQHEQNYRYFDLLDQFCDDAGCRQSTDEGYVIVFDRIHMTPEGSAYVGRNFKQLDWFQEILNSAQD